MCSSSPYIVRISNELFRLHYQHVSTVNLSVIADCLPPTLLIPVYLLFSTRFALNPIPLPHLLLLLLLLLLPLLRHKKCYVFSLWLFPSFLMFVFGCYYFNPVVSLIPLHAYSLTPCPPNLSIFNSDSSYSS